MVHVHKRLTLNGKTCLVEVVAATVERGRVESIAGAVGVTMNRSGAVSSSYLAVDVCTVADGV